jgi:hypothetical protein
MAIKQKFIPQCQLIPNFFNGHLPIHVGCKTKTKYAVRAVSALLCNWQLGAQLPITVQYGTVALKGSHKMGDGPIFLKTSAPLSLMTTYRMSLILAGSISLDSTWEEDVKHSRLRM